MCGMKVSICLKKLLSPGRLWNSQPSKLGNNYGVKKKASYLPQMGDGLWEQLEGDLLGIDVAVMKAECCQVWRSGGDVFK